MKVDFYNRLSFRQTLNTVLMTFVIGTILSAVQIGVDLKKEKFSTDSTAQQIISMAKHPAAQSVYHVDEDLAKKVVDGLLVYNPIYRVVIDDDFDNVFMSTEREQRGGYLSRLAEIAFGQSRMYSVPLIYSEKNIQVGYLKVWIDTYIIAESFIGRTGMIILGDIFRNVVLALFLTLLFYYSLTRPLQIITDRLSKINPARAIEGRLPFSSRHRNNELGLLVSTVNSFLQEIQVLNEELEQRVAERTTELEDSNKALNNSLEILNEARDQLVQSETMAALGGLVAGVSHEINTPVGIGVTASSFLHDSIDDFRGKLDGGKLTYREMQKFLNTVSEASSIILSNLKRAADMIQSFKQVAVDQSGTSRRVFNLKNYISEVLISLKPELRKTDHEIEINCPEYFEIDNYPGAFSQIITNLIMNSLTHGFENIESGIMTIDVSVNSNYMLFLYRDNGRGISPDIMPQIFDPFFTTKRGLGGTGLGMHIVFNLVTQQLGGTIECHSELNKGIEFKIKVPI